MAVVQLYERIRSFSGGRFFWLSNRGEAAVAVDALDFEVDDGRFFGVFRARRDGKGEDDDSYKGGE